MHHGVATELVLLPGIESRSWHSFLEPWGPFRGLCSSPVHKHSCSQGGGDTTPQGKAEDQEVPGAQDSPRCAGNEGQEL